MVITEIIVEEGTLKGGNGVGGEEGGNCRVLGRTAVVCNGRHTE